MKSFVVVCALAIVGAMAAPSEQDDLAQLKEASEQFIETYVKLLPDSQKEAVAACSPVYGWPCSSNSDCCWPLTCDRGFPVGTCKY
eukprot:Clim_evm3s76 gene=Clim_evmTU3s76